MRTMITALVAALFLTLGVVAATSAQDAGPTAVPGAATAGDVSATNSDGTQSATAGDAAATNAGCDETATADNVTATNTNCPAPKPAPAPAPKPAPAPTNLPKTGVGSSSTGNGMLLALLSVAAVGLAATSYRLRRS